MALHDVDISNENRNDPNPNKSDQQNSDQRMAHGTQGITYKVGTSGGPRVVTKDSQILANDGATNVALLGFRPDGTVGLWTVPTGTEVTTATESQFNFSSSRDYFKIIDTDTVNLGSTSSLATTSVPHNLSYRPTVIAYGTVTTPTAGTITVPLPYYELATSSSVAGAFVISDAVRMTVDSTNIIFSLRSAGATISATVRYYIIQETAVSS